MSGIIWLNIGASFMSRSEFVSVCCEGKVTCGFSRSALRWSVIEDGWRGSNASEGMGTFGGKEVACGEGASCGYRLPRRLIEERGGFIEVMDDGDVGDISSSFL